MQKLKPILTLIFVNILFGTGFPMVKVVLGYMSVGQWIFVRGLLSCLLLFILQYIQMSFKHFSHLGWVALAALFGVVINQICFAEGIHRTLSAHAAMINAMAPLMTLLLASLFIGERMTSMKMVGIVFGFLGVAYLLRLDHFRDINPYFKGDLLIFANATAYSLYLITARKTAHKLPPLLYFTWMSFIGMIGLGFYSHWDFPLHAIWMAPLKIKTYMLYLVVVPTVLCYVLNLWALKQVEASKAALFIYFQPVVAAVLGFWMLGDVPDHRFYVSGFLICIGVFLGSL